MRKAQKQRSRLPSFRSLAALEAVVRHGNIVWAADELGVTPGAVSKQLGSLEEELEAPLFHDGHRLRPTPVAIELAQTLGVALHLLREGWDKATHGLDTGVVTITGNASLCMHWLVPRVLAMQAAAGGRAIRVTSLHTSDTWWQSTVDIAILRHRRVPVGWESQTIGTERLTLLGSPERARRAAERGIAALGGETFLAAETRHGDLDRWLAAAGVGADTERRDSVHFYVAIEAALEDMGMVVAPIALCHDLIAQKRLAAPFPACTIRGAGLAGAYNRAICSPRTAESLFRWMKREMRRCSILPAV
ncbi:MAG TPA: LysR family transcriptional regulator [Devosia sp.]